MTVNKKSRKDDSVSGVLEQNTQKLNIPKRFKYKLVRESDGLTKIGSSIVWIEFNPNGSFKAKHDEPKVGYSLMLDPRISFTWLTTTITEIFYKKKNKIRFRTRNSIYVLEILK
jgi:hypothetical protein